MSFDRTISIAGTSTLHGEREVATAELAAAHETTEAAVRRSLGDARVFASERPCGELALEVAQRALVAAHVPAQSLSLVMSPGGSALRLQHELGAASAYVLQGGSDCTSLLAAMRTTFDLGRCNPEFSSAVVAVAERRMTNAMRSHARIDEKTVRDLFSDGASALVLVRGGDRLVLLGFGVATEGANWAYWERYSRGEAVELNDLQVIGDALPVLREAFARCLRAASLERDAIDFVIFPLEGATLPYTFARALRISRDKVYIPKDSPSHVGSSDLVFSLESLLRSGAAQPGHVILLCSRTIGVVHLALVRV